VCDLETSRMGAPYIYDISRLRVKRLYMFRASPLSKCTRRPPAENENTRGCIHVQL